MCSWLCCAVISAVDECCTLGLSIWPGISARPLFWVVRKWTSIWSYAVRERTSARLFLYPNRILWRGRSNSPVIHPAAATHASFSASPEELPGQGVKSNSIRLSIAAILLPIGKRASGSLNKAGIRYHLERKSETWCVCVIPCATPTIESSMCSVSLLGDRLALVRTMRRDEPWKWTSRRFAPERRKNSWHQSKNLSRRNKFSKFRNLPVSCLLAPSRWFFRMESWYKLRRTKRFDLSGPENK